ncbi:hypothetical protein FBU59_001035 [Linderina macrospora]|uniref:Uncharacterized protein n=1 Tax=Linderina macrospora TaxID=4868 RepID=A0ACC1JFC6_9FUNG|nr:hypothetical protein FBU59_001035 [Linderina macrospora]
MGQWEGVWTASHALYKSDLLAQQNEEMDSLCDAATWRLHKWDIDALVHVHSAQDSNSVASFDSTLNSLLAKTHRQRSLIEKLTFPPPLSTGMPIKAGPGDEATELDLVSNALQVIGGGLADSATPFGSQSSGTRMMMGTNISPDMIRAHMLGDIGLLANSTNASSSNSGVLSTVETTRLVEQWRARIACLPPTYSVQEPVLALHSSLYARLAGFRATALRILIRTELNYTIPVSLLAAFQMERAQIQWDEGNTVDAIAEIGRVVAILSDKLNLTSNRETAVQATFTAGIDVLRDSSANPSQQSQDAGDSKSVFVKATLLLAQ